ncbi:MAG: Acyl dehydratase [Rhodobacteraceae bacterium HLUCCA12]|nr:MAG: Acyl dehydratase [Rhodobacteraceae bacterium HLUCCA12]
MMQIGDHAETTRSFNQADLDAFAALAGSRIGADTVPEPLIGAMFSYLLGVELPGFGTNYLKQDMRFLAPAPLDTALTARVEITRLRPEKHLADLATTCRSADGTLICEGRALVLIQDVET